VTKPMQLGVLQMVSGTHVTANLAEIESLLAQSPPRPGALVLLPENAALMTSAQGYWDVAEVLGSGPIQTKLSELACQYACYLVIGSMPIKAANDLRCFTTSIAFGPDGSLLTHYNKLHLFDVDVADGVGRYRESDSFALGQELVTFRAGGVMIGMAICFDLRFPYLFELLRRQGCDILLLPAAFTAHTGAAHWEPLLRARAIENQCYVLAAGQGGWHGPTRQTWGHSCVIDPWGSVLVELPSGAGIVYSEFDAQRLDEIRSQMPLSPHPQLQQSWSK
jgi:nitrilase